MTAIFDKELSRDERNALYGDIIVGSASVYSCSGASDAASIVAEALNSAGINLVRADKVWFQEEETDTMLVFRLPDGRELATFASFLPTEED